MQTLHVQQRCVPPPFDIDSGVNVGMVGVTTRDAGEARLALAAPCINDTARGAGLTCEVSGDSHNLPASLFNLVGEDRSKLAPSRIQDGAVQASLLSDVPPRLSDAASRRASHPPGVQFFKHGNAEALRDIKRRAVVEIAANTGLPGLEPGNTRLSAAPAVRSSGAPCDDPLSLPLLSLNLLQSRRDRKRLTSGQRNGGRYATINADHFLAGGAYFLINLTGKGNVPTVRIPGDGDTLQHVASGSCISELHPPNLRQPSGAPFRAQANDGNVSSREPKRVVAPYLMVARKLAPSSEEPNKGSVQIPERLLLARVGYSSDPVEFRPQLGQFCGLLDVTELVASSPGYSLLQGDIVDQTTNAGETLEQGYLLWRRRKLISEAPENHSLSLTLGATEDNWRTPDA